MYAFEAGMAKVLIHSTSFFPILKYGIKLETFEMGMKLK